MASAGTKKVDGETASGSHVKGSRKDFFGIMCEYKKPQRFYRSADFTIRWVVVTGSVLRIYKSEREYHKDSRKFKKEIALKWVITEVASEPRHPHVLVLKDRGASHVLSFGHKPEMEECLSAITSTDDSDDSHMESDIDSADVDENDLNAQYEQILKSLKIPKTERKEMVATTSLADKYQLVSSYSTQPRSKSRGATHRPLMDFIAVLRKPEDVDTELLMELSAALYNEDIDSLEQFIEEMGLKLLIQCMLYSRSAAKELLRCFKATMDTEDGPQKLGLKYVDEGTAILGICNLLEKETRQNCRNVHGIGRVLERAIGCPVAVFSHIAAVYAGV